MGYRLIRKAEELLPYLSELVGARVMAVDTKTTGLDPHRDRLRLVQISLPDQAVWILDCFDFLPDGVSVLRKILGSPGVKVFHNAKVGLQFLMAVGIEVAQVFDTMLAAQMLRSLGGPARSSLAAICLHYLNRHIDKTEQPSDWTKKLTDVQLSYAARDAEVLLQLRKAMFPQIFSNGLEKVAKIEFDCVKAIAQMEYHGICLNLPQWEMLTYESEALRQQALERLYAYSGKPYYQLSLWGEEISLENHNFESNTFILQLLRQNGIDVPSTAKQHLLPYAVHPLVQALSDYRKSSKALSSFLYPIPAMINPITGRLHPQYGQIGAWSGRMSCGSPNIQQIPRETSFRQCFCAPEGKKLILADYSQIELRVAAYISGDKRMIAAYRNGEDLHRLTAALISDIPQNAVTKAQRQAAKAVNFGLIYGMGAAGLQQYARQSYGVEMTLPQAENFRDGFFRAYPGIADWHRKIQNVKPTEERTLSGRKFIFGQNSGVSGLYNTPVQGTAADIAKAALGLLVQRIQGTNIKVVAIVHDEILLEAEDGQAITTAELLKEVMEQAGNNILHSVPCVAEAKVADSWAGK